MTLSGQFINLNKKIIACKKCKRLKNFRETIAKKKRKQYINEKYWGKPITGFGDLNGKILLVGLAPAAHGGNMIGQHSPGRSTGRLGATAQLCAPRTLCCEALELLRFRPGPVQPSLGPQSAGTSAQKCLPQLGSNQRPAG